LAVFVRASRRAVRAGDGPHVERGFTPPYVADGSRDWWGGTPPYAC
jgi:hypothetical protein